MNEKVFEALKALAEKLGTTAEYLWGVLVRQAYVSFALWSLGLIFSILVVVAFKKALAKVIKFATDDGKNTWDWDDVPAWNVVVLIFCAVVGTITTMAVLVLSVDAIGGVLNPEYSALSKILGLVGG